MSGCTVTTDAYGNKLAATPNAGISINDTKVVYNGTTHYNISVHADKVISPGKIVDTNGYGWVYFYYQGSGRYKGTNMNGNSVTVSTPILAASSNFPNINPAYYSFDNPPKLGTKITGPNLSKGVCQGAPTQYLNFHLTNNNIACPLQGTLDFTNHLTGHTSSHNFSLSPAGSSESPQFSIDVPHSLSVGTKSNALEWNITSANFSNIENKFTMDVKVLQAGSVQSAGFTVPSKICSGQSSPVQLAAHNPGSCLVKARAKFHNSVTGNTHTSSEVTLKPGSTQNITHSVSMTQAGVNAGNINVRAELQSNESGSFQTVDTVEKGITAAEPNAQIIG